MIVSMWVVLSVQARLSKVKGCDQQHAGGRNEGSDEPPVIARELMTGVLQRRAAPVAALSRRLLVIVDDLLALLPESFDPERDHVAGLEKTRRLHAEADARRRSGRDHVAGLQNHE